MKTCRELLLTLAIHLMTQGYSKGTSTLTEGRRIAEGVPYSLVCTDSGDITQDVNFFKNTNPQGGCVGSTCNSGIDRYSVDQENRTTTLFIDGVDASIDVGSWTCRQGSEAASAPFVIESPIPSNLPNTSITVDPLLDESVTELVNITVSVPCAYPVPTVTWSKVGNNEPITSTDTTNSTECPSGQSKLTSIFTASSVQGSGTIVLQLRVEHDSFDPPDYAVVYTSGSIDSGGGSTTESKATTEKSVNGTTTDDTPIDDKTGLIVGCAVGVSCGLALTATVVYCRCCRGNIAAKRGRGKNENDSTSDKTNSDHGKAGDQTQLDECKNGTKDVNDPGQTIGVGDVKVDIPGGHEPQHKYPDNDRGTTVQTSM